MNLVILTFCALICSNTGLFYEVDMADEFESELVPSFVEACARLGVDVSVTDGKIEAHNGDLVLSLQPAIESELTRRDLVGLLYFELIRQEELLDQQLVVPVVRSSEILEAGRAIYGSLDFPVWFSDLAPGLVVMMATLDENGDEFYLHRSQVEALDLDDLFETGCSNIQRIFGDFWVTDNFVGVVRLHPVGRPNHFESSVLVCRDFWEQERFEAHVPLRVMVPSRGTVLICLSDDKNYYEAMLRHAKRMYDCARSPVSLSVFSVNDDGTWEIYRNAED